MPGYYATNLAGEQLQLCYELAPPRVKQYLQAEIDHAKSLIAPHDEILELGCGYGRILSRLVAGCRVTAGIDSSLASLRFGRQRGVLSATCLAICAEAARLPIPAASFDKVFCLQNGISAFKIAPPALLAETMRVLRPGGVACFSTYTAQFWPDRLAWFCIQSDAGLVGPIDESKTGNGVIVCTDGFTARTATREEFDTLAEQAGLDCRVYDVDDSSLFAEFRRR